MLAQTLGDAHHGMTRAALHRTTSGLLRFGLQYSEHALVPRSARQPLEPQLFRLLSTPTIAPAGNEV